VATVLVLACVDGLIAGAFSYHVLQLLAVGFDFHSPMLLAVMCAAPAWAIAQFALHNVYNTSVQDHYRQHLGPLLLAWSETAASLLFVIGMYLLLERGMIVLSGGKAGRMLVLFLTFGAGLISVRVIWFSLALPWFEPVLPRRNVMIIGATPTAGKIIERLRNDRLWRVNIVGVLDDQQEEVRSSFCDVPIIGPLNRAVECIRDCRIDQVLVASANADGARTFSTIDQLSMAPVEVKFVFDADLPPGVGQVASLMDDLVVASIYGRPMAGWSATMKRTEDLIISGVALVVLAPFLLAIAIAIKMDSSGPVFFRQLRWGFNNQPFQVLKFRTMHTRLTDHHARQQSGRGDPRVTRVGTFLRRHSLDELPQLFNALAGSMSVVGPRPHATATSVDGHSLQQLVRRYDARHRVKPGITGWAQINRCRGELDSADKLARRVELDLEYIENWSPLLDLRILAVTAWRMLHDDDAY
jgi:Undecaprenyl-phosphate glucose phosphotransferase